MNLRLRLKACAQHRRILVEMQIFWCRYRFRPALTAEARAAAIRRVPAIRSEIVTRGKTRNQRRRSWYSTRISVLFSQELI
jgi:hypothetical protein